MTTQVATNSIDKLITSVERRKRQAERDRQAELAKQNREIEDEARLQLSALFVGIADDILPLRCAEKPEYSNEGQFVELTWLLGSHEYELAPIHLTWRPAGSSYPTREGYIRCLIDDGGRGYLCPGNVTSDEIPQILYKARQSYAGWMAKIAKKEEEKRQEAISKLVPYGGWSSTSPLAGVRPRYEELSGLDPERADQEYQAWKKHRIAELTRTYNWDERRDEQFVTDLYNELALLDPDKAQAWLAHWRAAVARHLEREGRKADLARQLIDLAKRYLDATATYDAACAEWVAKWTDILWEPWHCWEIRYVPIGVTSLCTDEETDLVHEVATLEDATYVADRGPGTRIKKLATCGHQSDFVIGAFLDAKPVRFEAPATDERLDYHRKMSAGRYWLNIPPFVNREPEPLPARNPGTFHDFVQSKTGLPAPDLFLWDLTIEDLAEATPEDVLRDFCHWLNNNVD